ncbi:MAG: MFS transporter, partial [Pseudomonas sp.]
LLAGKIIVEQGMANLLLTVIAIALLTWLITLGRLIWRHVCSTQAMQRV